MRKIFYTILILTFYQYSFGQNLICHQKDNLKKGVYRTFEEFQTNSPSVEWKYSIETTTSGYGFLNAAGYIDLGRVVMEKEERKSFGNIYGFCDGKNIYIIPNEKNGVVLKKKTSFNKVEYLGRYVYYESINFGYAPNGTTTKSLDRRFLNINNGDNYSLTKSTLRTVLSQDDILLQEFEKEKGKKKLLKEYLIKYCEKNHSSNESSKQ